mmetsp:Transcript_9082/g.13660  ORF Transcript_9082/g.13660 Transcript_9082/m.13660 type:complete len:1968 (-) Transcript_9082:213-6116(-)
MSSKENNSPHGLFGLVGGFIWGGSRNSYSNNSQNDSSVDGDDKRHSSNSMNDMEPSVYSSELENQMNSSELPSGDNQSDSNSNHEEESDEEAAESEIADASSVSTFDDDIYDSQGRVMYKGQVIEDMKYRTLQKYLKSLQIKCKGKKHVLIMHLKKAVESGVADRMKYVSKLRQSPSAKYPVSERTPRTTPKPRHDVDDDNTHSPAHNTRSRSTVKPNPYNTRSTPARARTATKRARSTRSAAKTPSHRRTLSSSTDQASATVSLADAAPSALKNAKNSTKSATSTAVTAKKSTMQEQESDLDEYFSSEEYSPAVNGAQRNHGRISNLSPNVSPVPSPSLLRDRRLSTQSPTKDEVDDNASVVATIGSTREEDDMTELADHSCAIETASIAATVGSTLSPMQVPYSGSIDEDNENAIPLHLGDLPPPQTYPQHSRHSQSSVSRSSYAHSLSNQHSDDDRSSVVSFAEPITSVSPHDSASRTQSHQVHDALGAVGSRFMSMLRGEGPELSDAEYTFFKGLLESKRHNGASKNTPSLKDISSILDRRGGTQKSSMKRAKEPVREFAVGSDEDDKNEADEESNVEISENEMESSKDRKARVSSRKHTIERSERSGSTSPSRKVTRTSSPSTENSTRGWERTVAPGSREFARSNREENRYERSAEFEERSGSRGGERTSDAANVRSGDRFAERGERRRVTDGGDYERRKRSLSPTHSPLDQYVRENKRQQIGEPYEYRYQAYNSEDEGPGRDRDGRYSYEARSFEPGYNSFQHSAGAFSHGRASTDSQRSGWSRGYPRSSAEGRELMTTRRFGYPQHSMHESQTPSAQGSSPFFYTPRFQENAGRFSDSSSTRGYGRPSSSGVVPLSLQVQRSQTPGMNSVQRRLMARRMTTQGAVSETDGSYSASYGRSRASTASGAIAKKILDTLGQITTSLDDQRKKPVPAITTAPAQQEPAANKTKVRFQESEEPASKSVKFGTAKVVSTPALNEGGRNIKSIRDRQATPAAPVTVEDVESQSPVSARDSIGSAEQLWTRERGRSGGPSMSPPTEPKPRSVLNEDPINESTKPAASFIHSAAPPKSSLKTSSAGPSKNKDMDADAEFTFNSPTPIEGIDEDSDTAVSTSKVKFAFSPPGKKSVKGIDRQATPGVALKSSKPSNIDTSTPHVKFSLDTSPTIEKISGDSKSSAEMSKDSETVTEKPVVSGFAWAMPKGDVKCQVCLVYNDKSATKCVSCESPMGTPGSMPNSKEASDSSGPASTPAATGASFGGSKPSDGAISSSGFSFNSVSSSEKPSSSGSEFSFGGTSSAKSTSGGNGFTFGSASSNEKPASSGAGFSFGSAVSGEKSASTSLGSSSTSKPAGSSNITFGNGGSTTAPTASSSTTLPSDVTSKGFAFEAKPISVDEKKTENTDTSKESTTTEKPSFGFSANPLAAGKSFTSFSFSQSSGKDDSSVSDKGTTPSSSAPQSAPLVFKPKEKTSDTATSDTAKDKEISMPSFAFGAGASKTSISSFGFSQPDSSTSSSAIDFSKKVTSPTGPGFSFNKRSAEGSEISSQTAQSNVGETDNTDEESSRKKRAATDASNQESNRSVGESIPGLGGSPSFSQFGSKLAPPTESVQSGVTMGSNSTPSFGVGGTSVTPASTSSAAATKPSFVFGASTSNAATEPANTEKPKSSEFAFASDSSSIKPTFGSSSSASTSTGITGPFGNTASAAPSKPVTGVFGSSGGSSGSGSSFKFSVSGQSTTPPVSFSFDKQTVSASSVASSTTAPTSKPNFSFNNSSNFGSSFTATTAKDRNTPPPPPQYGSESPGSTMDTGYASGDASNMSTNTFLPPAESVPSTSGFIGSNSIVFGGSQSSAGIASGSATFGGISRGAQGPASTGQSQTSFGGFGNSSNTFGGAASAPTSSSSFAFGGGNPSSTGFGTGGGGFGGTAGGIASGMPDSMSNVGGFSLGASDKQKTTRRKLRAKRPGGGG